MKKIIVVILLIVMLFPIVGCSSAQPEDTVRNYFDAAQNLDIESMVSLIEPSNTEDIEETATLIEEQQDDYPEFLIDYLKANAGKITYKIVESTINGDKAVVTVDCKYVDSGLIIKATIGEVFVKMFGQAFSGVEMTDEETDQMWSNIMEEQIKTFDETFKEVNLNIDLVKREDKWYIAETSDEILDVVMSGFISAVKDVSDSFSSDGWVEDSIDGPGEEILEDGPVDVLWEIDNFITTDLWNDGFSQISWYLAGYDQEIDIDFTKSQLDKAMEKKAEYDEYIAELDSSFSDINEIWNKLSPEIDLMYQQVLSDEPEISTDRFVQYRDAFSDLVNDLYYSIDTTEEEIQDDDPEDVLWEINNFITTDLWNDGFSQISWYLAGYDQEIDIDFTKSQLDKAMEKKAEYDEYIAELDSSFSDINEIWNKLSPEIDLMYQQVLSDEPEISTDRFVQYRDAFSDLVNDFK